MARYKIYLRQEARGWQWTKHPDKPASWWGFYKAEGTAKGAAKRSVRGTVGGKSDPKDFEFIRVKP